MEQIANAGTATGLAGLLTALNLAPEPVIVLAKAPLALGAASAWAQGGIGERGCARGGRQSGRGGRRAVHGRSRPRSA